MSFQTRLLSSKELNDAGSTDVESDKASYSALARFISLDPQRYPYLLSSTASRSNNTQYDILFACPIYQLTLHADKSLSLTADEQSSEVLSGRKPAIDTSAGFFETLEQLYHADTSTAAVESGKVEESDRKESSLPFTGGWFVYLSYEMAEEIEPCLSLPSLPADQPLAVAARCPAAIIVDKANQQCIAIAEDKYSHLLDEIEEDFETIHNLSRLASFQADTDKQPKVLLESLTEADPAPYLEQVEKIKRYIIDGDIFQANLSRRWHASLHDGPHEPSRESTHENSQQGTDDITLFETLSANNPSSFAALAVLPEMTIISSSPERLVSIRDGIVETRPIAGTRPRHSEESSDEALAEELLAHPKEQAEHIMLIDLERNDLGRVCKPGSIEVNELMALESWEHVHHIVSNVRGTLSDGKSPIDVLRAVFPGGTITGCPKVRCIEILAEMEQEARGAYTGSLGYINTDGSMDFNILIRTMVRQGREITFRAGGGIVSDSIAEKELDETRAKAKGLLKIFALDANSIDTNPLDTSPSKQTDTKIVEISGNQ